LVRTKPHWEVPQIAEFEGDLSAVTWLDLAIATDDAHEQTSQGSLRLYEPTVTTRHLNHFARTSKHSIACLQTKAIASNLRPFEPFLGDFLAFVTHFGTWVWAYSDDLLIESQSDRIYIITSVPGCDFVLNNEFL
jgi:hypothetical protein